MIELIYTLIMTHITIVCVTLYLHRGQTHKSILFHPILGHFMRFWLWLTTGMITREWVAVHRLHHQKCDGVEDPHSPKIYGIWSVLFGGAFLYRRATMDVNMIKRLSQSCPNDWMEKHLYTKYNLLGIVIMLSINIALFEWWGVLVWAIQMIWVPFWAAGVVNGIGHYWGYRNHSTDDSSKNIFPLGVIIGGEELHNNHHNDPTNAKLSNKWFEFDIGWMWIKIFKFCRLLKLRGN